MLLYSLLPQLINLLCTIHGIGNGKDTVWLPILTQRRYCGFLLFLCWTTYSEGSQPSDHAMRTLHQCYEVCVVKDKARVN